MPKLLLFAPCERVIIDQDDNNVSLITLLQELGVSLPGPEKIPADAPIVTRWQILAIWLREADDEGKHFEQVCTITLPDGRTLKPSGAARFTMMARTHRQVLTLRGFPVSKEPGECYLRLHLREDTEGSELQQVAEYAIQLKHAAQ